ncbi:hypothetical protein JOB18_041629 [Solea senegalensis]|uniref:Uncharacterized protein n=1 Tax=Solea senegalensis TaxID=28829 RepID=A0AAV6Q3A4_SOLSE|nr:hypothetical protein JOB18_041629 [Solea senegalensis]
MILHSSAAIDLEHNVASQQTNVAIISALSGTTTCLLRTVPPFSSSSSLTRTAPDAHFITITTKKRSQFK